MKGKNFKCYLIRGMILVGIFVLLYITIFVKAFEEYEITPSNDFQIEVKQKRASNNTTGIKYATEGWYLFKEKIGASEYTKTAEGVSIDANYYKTYGFKLTTGVENRIHRTKEDENGIFYDTFQFDAEKIVPAVLKWYEKDGVIDREALINGITVYASRALNVVVDGKIKSTHYNYQEIAKQANWTNGTLNAFYDSYDKPITLQFHAADFSIEIADENGNIPEGYDNVDYVDTPNRLLYGENVTYQYPGEIAGYKYVGFEWRIGNIFGEELEKLNSSSSTGTYTIVYSKEVDSNGIVLVFRYEKIQPPPTPTKEPTNTPTSTPKPTLPPGITATSTPLPTNTPTPLPTSTPKPTSLPTKDINVLASEEYYFSTDEGYTMRKIVLNSDYELVSSTSSNGAGTINTSTYTQRDKSYLVGTDEKGNKWHFIQDGTDATYVHPSIYNGYDVNGTDVKYITELVFPSALTYNGTSYNVVSIGGGTAKYKSIKEKYEEKWDEDTDFGYYKDYYYRIESGYYNYYKCTENADSTYIVDYNNKISYAYGVIGNGKIESNGSNYYEYTNGTIKDREFIRSYYVYNTTLQSITIPSTVTTILPYAFYGCQALIEIKGAENVIDIGEYAFQAINPILLYSSEWTENSYKSYDMYYYNESYSMLEGRYTDTMLNWEEACQLSSYLHLPKFPILTVIGDYAFEKRRNLYDVILSDTVKNIGDYAFQYCNLNSITIPGETTKVRIGQNKYYTTLGANGLEEDKTIIYTVPNSKAMEYGLTYSKYYRLKSGYPVIYESNGSNEEAKSYSSDVKIEEDKISYFTTIYGNMFTYDGHRFIGWNTKADGTGTSYLPGQEVELEGSLLLYAQWERRKPIIRYDKNGGSGTMADTIVESESISIILPDNMFVRKGYEFIGWNTKADGTGVAYADKAVVSNVSGVLVLYAQWKKISTNYILLYMKYPYGTVGNTVWKQKVLEYDAIETVEGAPYTITGNKVAYSLNTSNTMSTIPKELELTTKNTMTSAPIFEKWQFYKENDIGTMIYQGKQYKTGTILSALTKENGEVCYLYPKWNESGAVVVLPSTSCVGYRFDGWSESLDGSGERYYAYGEDSEEEIGTFAPVKDTLLYAIWTPEKKVVKLDGQQAEEQIQNEVLFTFDSLVPKVEVPKRKQYVFQGYYTGKDGTGIKVIDKNGTGVIVSNEINGCFYGIDILYAYWIPEKQILYHPNYSPLDSDCKTMEDTWIDFDKTGTYLSKNLFTKQGYHFVSWNTKSDGSGVSYQDGAYIDGVTTRIVLYAQWAKNTYIVHYAKDVYENNPEISNSEEDIWFYDNTYIVKEKPYIKQDIVSYNLNRGNKSKIPQMVTQLTQEYTNSIYPFLGYRLYEKIEQGYKKTELLFQTGEEVRNLTSQEGKEFVLFPEWEKFSKGILLPIASCIGYQFHGWVTSAIETNLEKILQSPYITEKSITLYAYWTPKQYEVILNDRGATSKEHSKTVIFTFDELGQPIQIPSKRGYTFHGYYTEPRGAGTKYYDKSGICIKTWTEENQNVLYAYWIQDEVIFPKEENKIEPEVLPQIEYKGEIARTDEKILLYADDYDTTTGALNDLQPYITFSDKGKIPSTEQIAIRGKMGAWQFSYYLRRISGKDYVRIYVTVPYRTQYEKQDETLVISEQKKKTYEILVPKVWSYWEVVESGLYYPTSVIVKNEALQNGQEEIVVKDVKVSSLCLPEYQVNTYEQSEHVFWEMTDSDGKGKLELTLTEEQYIISNIVEQEPNVDAYLSVICTNEAWKDKRQCNIRNDLFVFDGTILLSDAIQTTGHGCELMETSLPKDITKIGQTNYEQTYLSGIELNDMIANGIYETSAFIRYEGDEKNIGVPLEKIITVSDVNALQIHTPVACCGILENDIQNTTIHLKEDLNFFSLMISNIGTHRSCLGYGTKDFSIALSGASNIAMQGETCLNQVKIPFDVFIDRKNDTKQENKMEDDVLVRAGTWITLGKEKVWFYIPATQENGRYVLEFRSIAVNCPKNELQEYRIEGTTEEHVNLDSTHYIATDKIEVIIQSYVEDFEIIDTNDPEAVKKLQQGLQALKLKKGYEFSYRLFTKGMFYGEEAQIQVIPSYYWVSEDEKEREKVEVYYQADLGQIEKIVYSPKLTNLPTKYCNICGAISKGEENLSCGHNNSSTEILTWESEIEQEWHGSYYLPSKVFCIGIDMIQGYCANCKQIKYVSGGKNSCNTCQAILQNKELFNYEEYTNKNTLHGQEAFFKQTGYLIISFDIQVKSTKGEWYVFDAWENTKLAKDIIAKGWNYQIGDVIRYDLSSNMSEDYEVGGIE